MLASSAMRCGTRIPRPWLVRSRPSASAVGVRTFSAAAASSTPVPPAQPSHTHASPPNPPPMELPSFLTTALLTLRRRFLSSPNAQAMALYTFALRNPIARPSSSTASKELNAIVSHDTGLYALNLPDDELTRFRMIGLHLWILQKVLLTSLGGPETQQAFIAFQPVPSLPAPSSREQQLLYYLFEHFWADLTPFLKTARGEIKLTKTIKSVQEYFYGAFVTMDMAWAPSAAPTSDGSPADPLPPAVQREYLAAALWRNYWMSDNKAEKRDVYKLIYYIQRQMEHLAAMPKERLWHGESLDVIDWLPISTVFDKGAGAGSDAVLSKKLSISPQAWKDGSFEMWREQMLQGQTFDTRMKKY